MSFNTISGVLILILSFIRAQYSQSNNMVEVNQLKVACWNVRGYLSATPYLRKLLSQVDVLAISEHWLHSNRLNILNDISDTHCVFARSSVHSSAEFFGSRRGQGGVAIFWRKNLPGFTKVSNIIHDRACVLRFQPLGGDVYFFISMYLPAQGCDDDLPVALDEVSEIIETCEAGSKIILLGDFNGDVGSLGGPRGIRDATARGRYIMNFLNRHAFIAVNMQALTSGPVDTFVCHNGQSTIDYITVPAYMANEVRICHVNSWDVLNTSDHRDIHMTLSITGDIINRQQTPKPSRIKWEKSDTRHVYSQRIFQPLVNLWERLSRDNLTEISIDGYFQELTTIIHEAASDLPRTKYVKHIKPYWNEDLGRLKRDKILTYRTWVNAGRPRNPEDPPMVAYKASKKLFAKTLRTLARQYESEEIIKATSLAEVNSNSFWRLLKRCRNTNDSCNISIKRSDGVVVNEVDDVLEVWREHFASLGTPKNKPNFDDDHFRAVTDFIGRYNAGKNIDDDFLLVPFSIDEINGALKNLNRGKAAGYDLVSAEHVVFAGGNMADILLLLYNAIADLEVIPACFRTGVQIPLFKGKDLDVLDPNNYRGITLLSTFNKVFEILIWNRLKVWWKSERIISELQGACKTGISCIHTAFILQETVAASMEESEHCFIAFFDIAKAFDTVWIDGLFKQVYHLGITGKTWRLLYRGYVDFRCRVRIGGSFSEPYALECGIHQGGYLSLLKYTVFINSLLVELQNSGLCAKIYNTPSTPQGYADDLATVCLSKRRTDTVMDIVYNHGCKWRYDFNARKSGILVYGENHRAHLRNSKKRLFKLGPARVREVTEYDHVGVKTSIFADNTSGIEDRIGKARRALNAISGIGIRRRGLNIATCNIIFWSIVVPIALFGCELWRLNGDSINMLQSFQIYAGKKFQRFYSRIPNVCSFFGLGWMRLVRIIQVRKLLFVHAIMSLEDGNLSKIIFIERARRVLLNNNDIPLSEDWSIVDDLLKVASLFNFNNEVSDMVLRGHLYTKSVWKRMVWTRGWSLEDTHWRLEARLYKELDLLTRICPNPRYLTWWNLSNKYGETIYFCEIMAKIISHASLLKCDDVRLKHLAPGNRICSLCNLYVVEDIYHIVMQCPGTQHLRREMSNELDAEADVKAVLLRNAQDYLPICLGMHPKDCEDGIMERLWSITGKHICNIYRFVLNQRQGVG